MGGYPWYDGSGSLDWKLEEGMVWREIVVIPFIVKTKK